MISWCSAPNCEYPFDVRESVCLYFSKYSIRCLLGCSLFIKNALYFTGIESCSWVTEISLKILELMIFAIGKKTPRHTLFGGNPTTATIFVKFSCFIFTQPHELPNYSRIHCPWLQYEPLYIWDKSQFWGKNEQFCDY